MLDINDPFDVFDEEFEKVKAASIEQGPLIRKPWDSAGEVINLFSYDKFLIFHNRSNAGSAHQSAHSASLCDGDLLDLMLHQN